MPYTGAHRRDSYEIVYDQRSLRLRQINDEGCPFGDHGFRKIRMAIKSKGKGKSGGARVITFNYIIETECQRIVLVKMYDKSEISNITEAEIRHAFETL